MNRSLFLRVLDTIREYRAEQRKLALVKPRPSRSSLFRWLPSRGNVLFSTLLVGALLVANRAGALTAFSPASPTSSTTTIPYQGRLASAGGSPLTGTHSMVFRLYSQAGGGAPLWEETWTGPNGVRVSDGLFNVMLGSLSAIPPSVVTGNANLWLGITVGVDAEMAPRVQLGTVPYAIQALSVPDGSITGAKLADGSVGTASILSGSISSEKLAFGGVTSDRLADGAVTSAKLKPASGIVRILSDQPVVIASSYGTAPIPQTTFEITLSKPSRVLIWYSVVAYTTYQNQETEQSTFIQLSGPAGTTSHARSTHNGPYFKTYSSVDMLDLPAGAYSGQLWAQSSWINATLTFAGNRGNLMLMVVSQ